MNLNQFFIFLIIFFKIGPATTPSYQNRWVVWNIGQGQWVTHILFDECRHFDMGGEFGSFQRIRSSLLLTCGSKINKIFLSHWDYDHYSNVSFAARSLPKLCWSLRPNFSNTKSSAKKILDLQIPICNEKQDYNTQLWEPNSAENTNESSIVALEQKVLLPGDSPVSKEKKWIREMYGINTVKFLILGHHGSRTSTGRDLLAAQPGLQLAIASARYQKYKHPHTDTIKRLYESNVPVIKTEDWGNIWFEIID